MARTEISSGQIIQIYDLTWHFSHILLLYHNVSPCHFSDRIHISLITYSQIYFWGGDGLPSPPFCDGSDLRQLHGQALQSRWEDPAPLRLFKRQLCGGEWLKEEDLRCSFETVKQSTPCLIGAELFTWPGRESKCLPDVFLNGEKSTIFANSPASVCFSEHQYVSVECKIYMDCNGSSGNGEYCAYNETTAPISADCLICHHRYKQWPVSKPVKTPGGAPLQWSWLVGSAVLTPLFQGTGKKYRILTPLFREHRILTKGSTRKKYNFDPHILAFIEFWPSQLLLHRILTPVFQWLIEYWPPFLWPHIDFWPLFFSSAATHRILTPLFWRP